MKNLGLLLLLVFALVIVAKTPSLSESQSTLAIMKKNPVPEDPPGPKTPPKAKDEQPTTIKG